MYILSEMVIYYVHSPIAYSCWSTTSFDCAIYKILVSKYFYKIIFHVDYLLNHLWSIFGVAVTHLQLLELYFLISPRWSIKWLVWYLTLKYPTILHFQKRPLIPYLWSDNEQHKIVCHLCVCIIIRYIPSCYPKLCKCFLNWFMLID